MTSWRSFLCFDAGGEYIKICVASTPARAATKGVSGSPRDIIHLVDTTNRKAYSYFISSRSVGVHEIQNDSFLQAENVRRSHAQLKSINRRLHASQIKPIDQQMKELITKNAVKILGEPEVVSLERRETAYKRAARELGYFKSGGPFKRLPEKGTKEHDDILTMAETMRDQAIEDNDD